MTIEMNRCLIAAIVVALCAFASADAAQRGGHGGGGTRTSVGSAGGGGGGGGNRSANAGENRGANANANTNRNANVNSNTNVNRNTNVNSNTNVNRSTNVNVDVDNGWDNHSNHWDHPVAAAATVGTAMAVTAAAIGSVAYSVPPSCVPVNVNGMTYQQCGSTWYQPQYSGSSVQYIVIAPPH
jgi:hypothetical protein